METIKKYWKKYWWVAVIIAIAIIAVIGLSCGSPGDGKTDWDPKDTCPAGKSATTAKGICLPTVYQEQALSQIDRADGGFVLLETGTRDPVLRKKIGDTVIKGLEGMIAAALHYNPTWQRFTTTGGYQVVMINKMATNMDGTPALLVSGYQSAGTVINVYGDLQERATPIIILPIPDDWNAENYWPYLENSAWNEGEHVIEWLNDKAIFRQNAIVQDVHPHWPPVATSRGLVEVQKSEVDRILLGEASQAPIVLPVKIR